jgi:WD40 repeat protein
LAFNPDPSKKILATGGGDNNIIFWNAETGNQISQLPSVHSNGVLSLAFSPDRKYLVSGDGDGQIILWDLQSLSPRNLFKGGGPIKTLAFSPDSQVIAFGNCSNFNGEAIIKCDNPTVNLMSLDGEFISEPMKGHQDLVESIAFSPNGEVLASGSDDNTVILWSFEKKQQIGKPLVGHLDWVYIVVFVNDSLFASGSRCIYWALGFGN